MGGAAPHFSYYERTLMSDQSKSVLWILNWSLMHTLLMSCAKAVNPDLNIFTMVFVRAVFGVVFLLPLMHGTGWKKTFVTKNLKLQLVRAVIVLFALASSYYAYRNLVLNLATSIGFTQPLIITILALLFLGERVRYGQWLALMIGYGGVFCFVNPFSATFDPTIFVALLANLFSSTAIILTKVLSRTDKNITIMSYSYVGLLLISGILVMNFWVTPKFFDLVILFAMGGLGTLSQYSYITALKYGNASFVAPFEYSRLVIAIPIGYFVFGEGMSWITIVGAVVIIFSNLYIARQKEV
jgi:drug/metabolite transporter (DMT)-like permease